MAVRTQKKSPPKALLVAIPVLIVVVIAAIYFGPKLFSSPAADDSRGIETEESATVEPSEDMPTAVSKDAENELLGYIDQAQELVTKAYEDVSALADAKPDDVLSQQASVVEASISELSDLQKQAAAVKCPDKKFANAQEEYFNMLCDAQNSFLEVWTFLVDYFDLYENVLYYRPEFDIDSVSAPKDNYVGEYFNALNEWYESASNGYAAINSCPPCMASQWAAYGKTLDLNDNILTKLAKGYRNEDYLNLYSAGFMQERYYTVEELQFNGLIDSQKGEQDFFVSQKDIAFGLAEELHNYAELDEAERDAYEFEYVRTGKILYDFKPIDTIYPSMYNTYDAFLIVNVGCISGTRKILVEAEIPGFTQKYAETFTVTSAYQKINIKPPALTGELSLSSAKQAQIQVTLSEQETGTIIKASSFNVTIKSLNDVEWYTDEYGISTKDNILCLLTPEAPGIDKFQREAADALKNISGANSFVGYQEAYGLNHYATTYLQAAALMNALYEQQEVVYVAGSFSMSESNQRVKLPDEVLESRGGLCIETALVIASALQRTGMHAFLVFPPGHAQVAVEVWPSGEQAGQYLLIETTALSDRSNNAELFWDGVKAMENLKRPNGPISYLSAEDWHEKLANVQYIIDCNDAQTLGLTPFVN